MYGDLKRNRYRTFAVTYMTTVASAVLFRSESKASGFNANERPFFQQLASSGDRKQ